MQGGITVVGNGNLRGFAGSGQNATQFDRFRRYRDFRCRSQGAAARQGNVDARGFGIGRLDGQGCASGAVSAWSKGDINRTGSFRRKAGATLVIHGEDVSIVTTDGNVVQAQGCTAGIGDGYGLLSAQAGLYRTEGQFFSAYGDARCFNHFTTHGDGLKQVVLARQLNTVSQDFTDRSRGNGAIGGARSQVQLQGANTDDQFANIILCNQEFRRHAGGRNIEFA